MAGKLIAVGAIVTGATPVPLRATVCVPALSTNVRVPLNAPRLGGEKLTVAVHLALAARLAGQLLVSAKGTEVDTCDTATAVVPVFVSVTTCAPEVVPLTALPRNRVAGLTETVCEMPTSGTKNKKAATCECFKGLQAPGGRQVPYQHVVDQCALGISAE